MMAVTREQTENQIQWLTDEEAHAAFEEEARRVMGMSGEEFIRRWDAGEYDEIADSAGYRHIMHLAMLIPWGR